ncbi:MAG: RsmD family RNA methyltransferase [Methanosphaera sp.]|nr:RsmD family RNA methyltransferase [Methanosphaera sp.]
MNCNCTSNCIKSNKKTLELVEKLYKPCSECNTRKLKKAMPLVKQVKLDKIDSNYRRCPKCNRRHIDVVMAHILKIMIENGLMSKTSSIRKVGTPLITPAIVLEKSPYIDNRSLVLITTHTNQSNATRIYDEVSEVKAVIKGDTNNVVGQVSIDSNINEYELLVGCDIRCDIQDSPEGKLCIYKPQSKIHIEYPKPVSQKIMDVDKTLSEYDNPTVIDAMAGCGTLGIYALKKNAKTVLFNDINPTATDTIKTNLEVNGLIDSDYTINTGSVEKLVDKCDTIYDVAFIDAFPDVNITHEIELLENVANKVVII